MIVLDNNITQLHAKQFPFSAETTIELNGNESR